VRARNSARIIDERNNPGEGGAPTRARPASRRADIDRNDDALQISHLSQIQRGSLLDEGEDLISPAKALPVGAERYAILQILIQIPQRPGNISRTAGGKHFARIGVVECRQADIFQIVLALRPPPGFAGRLNGGQEQRHQGADDRDHHQ
jgi:hypothetical protein